MPLKKEKLKNVTEAIKKKSSIIGEFKKFIARGNVLDMAVGVIVGGAFTSIVNSLVDDMLMPVIGMILAGINFCALGVTIPWGNEPYINIGNFLQAVITFIITAFCVFVIVKVINRFHKKEIPEKTPDKPTKEEELLAEIRDLLKLKACEEALLDKSENKTAYPDESDV